MLLINLVSLLSHTFENVLYKFINSVIEEIKYCSNVMKKHFNKELLMTKEGDEDFENSCKCWICNSDYVDGDAKVTIIVLLLENIEALHIEFITSRLN